MSRYSPALTRKMRSIEYYPRAKHTRDMLAGMAVLLAIATGVSIWGAFNPRVVFPDGNDEAIRFLLVCWAVGSFLAMLLAAQAASYLTKGNPQCRSHGMIAAILMLPSFPVLTAAGVYIITGLLSHDMQEYLAVHNPPPLAPPPLP